MIPTRMWTTFALVILSAAVAGGSAVAARVAAHTVLEKEERSRVAFSWDLPRLNGAKLAVTVVEVSYGPGESSMPHSHPCPVIGYVLEGSLRTQVKGNTETIYKAGESFYEAPNGVHLVTANASDKKPMKLLAFFVCDHNAPLSLPVPETKDKGGK
jgi:quercetin dioxygenase-like cupin family protein